MAADVRRKKEARIRQALNNAPPEWVVAARKAVRLIAMHRLSFTAADVWRLLEAWKVPVPHEKRALGAVLLETAYKGWIRSSDSGWTSLIYVEGKEPDDE